jgi:eukaryotic-like serine/threonine-protein kinase
MDRGLEIPFARGALPVRHSKLRLEDYQLGESVGVGTVGAIHAAIEIATGKQVAVKLLHPSVSRDPLIRARFEREMLILSRLNHPNIVRYDGGGEAAGQLFYVMELVDGGTIRDLLQASGQLSWQEVVACTRQICSALQCAHNHGVVHRDLKPANLFLTREGRVKLGDFGIARDLTSADLTADGLTVGTHAYMAPEQITGEQAITGKADLYALGCCMFEMLTGQKPFQGDNFAQLFEKHLRAEPPRVCSYMPHVPPELDEVVYKLLAKNPLDRPFNARQVQGVMYQIIDRYQLEPERKEHVPGESKRDVGAEDAVELGRLQLQRRIAARMGERQVREISWPMLLGLVAILVALALFYMLFFNG